MRNDLGDGHLDHVAFLEGGDSARRGSSPLISMPGTSLERSSRVGVLGHPVRRLNEDEVRLRHLRSEQAHRACGQRQGKAVLVQSESRPKSCHCTISFPNACAASAIASRCVCFAGRLREASKSRPPRSVGRNPAKHDPRRTFPGLRQRCAGRIFAMCPREGRKSPRTPAI